MRVLVALVALIVAPAIAYAGNVQAKLDRAKASLEDEITLTIAVVGDAEKPELPSSLSTDFEVQSSGQANQVSIINGRMSSSTRYTYTLVPRHSGTLTVPAIPVEVDGTRLATEPLQVQVVAGAAPGTVGDGIAMSAELVPATGERESAYVGEQLIYTLRILARVNANCPGLKLPDIPDAASYPLGEQRQYRTRIDGEEVSVVEERRAVFADKPGVLEIPAVRLTCTIESGRARSNGFDDFFQRFNGTRKVLRSNAARLSIQALPKPPADFSGLVGDLSLVMTASKPAAHVGDSVTLSIRLAGSADITSAREPQLVLRDGVKVYDDKPMVRYDASGTGLVTERTFQKALVAQRPGELVIPSPSVIYFDPARRAYHAAEAPALNLQVIAGSEPGIAQTDAPPPPAPPTIESQSTPSAPAVAATVQKRAVVSPLATWTHGVRLWVLIVVPLVAALLLRRRRGASASPLAAQRRKAAEHALAELRGVGEDPREISRVVRQLIGAHVQHHGTAFSTHEALDALGKSGLDAGLVAKAHAVLTGCDAAIYGGAKLDVYLRDDAIGFARGVAESA